jgi:hypothetical protein
MAKEQIESPSYKAAKDISFRLKPALIPSPFTLFIDEKWIKAV